MQATRMLFYQRDGFAKTAQYAGADWADGAAHTGMCYLYNDGSNDAEQGSARRLVGRGRLQQVHELGRQRRHRADARLLDTPAAFTDATNIPESGNGVADLLDEVKWELDWLGRMQQSDGSVLSVVDEPAAKRPPSALGNTAPSTVTTPCYYGPASTSASLTAAAAYASRGDLRRRPRRQHRLSGLRGQPRRTGPEGLDLGAGEPRRLLLQLEVEPHGRRGRSGSSDDQSQPRYGLLVKKLQAALYLFEATGTTSYRDFFDANYSGINLIKSGYADGSHGEEQETLLEYIHAPNATASVVSAIKSAYLGALQTSDNLGAMTGNPDPYLAYLSGYWWGINQIKSDQGNLLYDVVTFGIDPGTNAEAAKGAERYVHYLHGVNPLQLVYLSNMGATGRESRSPAFSTPGTRRARTGTPRASRSTGRPPAT